MVPLRHALTNGDVVEIVTQKGHTPSRDWLSFIHTSRARSKIRQWINLHERQEATDVGRRLLEKEARQAGVSLKKISSEDLQRVATEYGCSRVDDLYADLGYGKWSARQVIAKATGQPLPANFEEKPPKPASNIRRMLGLDEAAIIVRGHDDLMVYRSKCCNPFLATTSLATLHAAAESLSIARTALTLRTCYMRRIGESPSNGLARRTLSFRCNCASSLKTGPACLPPSLASSVKRAPTSELLKVAEKIFARASKLR